MGQKIEAVVYKFPCGTGADKGARETLGDLFETALQVRFKGDIIAAAEAYNQARIDQLAGLMSASDVKDIEYIDADDYWSAMIGVVAEWANEVDQQQKVTATK